MRKISFSMLITCFWGLVALFSLVLPQTPMMYICCIVGGLGIIYCICFLWKLFVKPIERDLIIAKGNYLWKVCSLVIVIPFSLTLIMEVVNKVDEKFFSPEKLVYDKDLQGNDKHTDIYENEPPTLFWTVYYHFVDPGNQHMAARTMIGCVSAAIIAILGIFLLNGLLVSSIIGWIDKRKEKWQEGQIRYGLRHLGRNRFAIVIGANEISATVIKNLLTTKSVDDINFKSEGTNNYVILHTKREVQMVREFLSSHLSSEMLDKVIIYNGLRDSKRELERLCLAYSTEIYVLGESEILDGGENYHDATNMQCVNLIADILETEKIKKDNNPPLKKKICKVLFDYQTTFSIFQFSDIPSNVKNNLVFIPFSRYEAWARKVIVDGYCYLENSQTLIDYIPLDGQGLEQDSDKHVHFVIVGMSKMGIAMGVQAMLQCHYLNYKKTRTRITFIDTNADKEMAFFKGRYYNVFELTRHRYVDTDCQEQLSSEWIDPVESEDSKWKHLSSKGKNFIDVELEFIKGEIESDGVREYLKQISNDSQSKLTIAICLTQTHQAVAASLY
ncbi:MAG: hypothetical protein IJ417_06090, partial [Bacteroidaceae bacterium]|nr:hypothetical protein [Bacteroidaceae bacterium]